MAVPATVHWEVRTDGNNDNGGAFNFTRSGVDYPLTNTVFVYSGNLVQPGTDKNRLQVSSGRHFESGDIGNVINLTGGTGIIPGRYEITNVSGGIATLDTNCWTTNSGGSGGSGRLGGAIAHPVIAVRVTYQSNTRAIYIWMRSGDYYWSPTQVIVTSDNISDMHFEGYAFTRGDGLGYATWKATSGVLSILDTLNPFTAYNIIFDANGESNAFGPMATNATFYNCRFLGFRAGVIAEGYSPKVHCVRCVAHDSRNIGFGDLVTTVGCVASSCDDGFGSGVHVHSTAINCVRGFTKQTGKLAAINCIAYNCSTGFISGAGDTVLVNCVSFGAAANGFEINESLSNILLANCEAESSGSYGFSFDRFTGPEVAIVHRIRGFNNTSGLHNMTNSYAPSNTLRMVKSHDVSSLTASPFVNPSSGDFRLKRTSPAYSQCKAILQNPPNVTVDWEPKAYNVGQVRQFDEPEQVGGGVIVIEED